MLISTGSGQRRSTVRYLDTATSGSDHSLEQWLLAELPGARVFAAQTGCLTHHGVVLILPQLEQILATEGEVHLVTGAREEQVTPDDLWSAVRLLEPHGGRGTLVLVDERMNNCPLAWLPLWLRVAALAGEFSKTSMSSGERTSSDVRFAMRPVRLPGSSPIVGIAKVQ
jgi:hypothetical protein